MKQHNWRIIAKMSLDRKCPFILVFCVTLLVASILLQPAHDGVSFFGVRSPLRCFLRHSLGVRCALCGLTRSVCSLAHGRLDESLEYHLLGPAVFAFICVQILYRSWEFAVRPEKMSGKLKTLNFSLTAALIFAVMVNWLVYLGGLFQ